MLYDVIYDDNSIVVVCNSTAIFNTLVYAPCDLRCIRLNNIMVRCLHVRR